MEDEEEIVEEAVCEPLDVVVLPDVPEFVALPDVSELPDWLDNVPDAIDPEFDDEDDIALLEKATEDIVEEAEEKILCEEEAMLDDADADWDTLIPDEIEEIEFEDVAD